MTVAHRTGENGIPLHVRGKLSVQLATRLRLHPRWERITVRRVPTSPRPWDAA